MYLTGAVPDVGESLTSLACATEESAGAAQAAREAVHVRPDGMIELDADSARPSLFMTAPRDAPRRPSPSWSLPTLQLAPNRCGWPRGAMIPVTYIRGTADRMPQLVSPVSPFESIKLIELPTAATARTGADKT